MPMQTELRVSTLKKIRNCNIKLKYIYFKTIFLKLQFMVNNNSKIFLITKKKKKMVAGEKIIILL